MRTFFKKFFASSADPEKISLTVKSTLVMLIPGAIILAKSLFNIDLQTKDLMDFITVIATVASGLGVIYGVARKIYFKIN